MTRRARPFYAGQRIQALRDPLNRLVRAINEQPGGGRAAVPAAAASVALEIKALGATTLTCVDPGNDASAREYTVAVPPTFTEASRGGVSYVYTDINNRTADGTETQKLTPEYIVGDTIRAAWRLDGDGSLIDLNIDGRQWAKV